MRFGALGPLTVWTADGGQIAVPELKVRTLLAVLVVNRGRTVSVDELADALWGEGLPRNPAAALQNKVWQLRKALDAAEPGARALVVARQPGYQLQVGEDAVDADRFLSLVTRAGDEKNPRTKVALLTEALGLWRGAALADFADHGFTRAATALWEEQRLVAIEERAEARLELGEHQRLIRELEDVVARHPLRERLRAVHVRALYQAGRQRDALAHYEEMRRQLAEEFGVDPSPALTALHQAILHQRPELDPPPVHPRTNLPTPLTPLIGREQAARDVCELLGDVRLVTLTGTGGVGKTRLAVETAARLAEGYPDGVWLVELGPLSSPDVTPAEVAEVVMGVLGIRDDGAGGGAGGGPAGPLQRLNHGLRAKRLLLVLDNCEHVVDQVAQLAEPLLRSAPGVRVLATSQEALGIAGEVTWRVPPLALPDPDAGDEPATLGRYSAMKLFVARAAAAQPGFTLDATNVRDIATLCKRLDGVPLALELAATKVRSLGVRELVARLDDRFRVLATGQRGAPPRQQTLRAMIDWSWDLLSEPERAVLRRLAVQVESWALEAAESVCAGGAVPAADVPDLLARLVDRSLVVVTEGGRYRLLESVAAYSAQRLREAGEHETVRRAHNRFYADLAEQADRRLRGHGQRHWLERLDAETGNLRGALDGAVHDGDAHLALRLVNAQSWYWFLRGRLGEAVRLLDLALGVTGTAPASARARATTWRTGFVLLQGEDDKPVESCRTALAGHEDAGDAEGLAWALWFLSFSLHGAGESVASEQMAEEALRAFQELGHDWGIAAALTANANRLLFRGDLEGVRADGERSAALFRELGDEWGQLQSGSPLAALAEISGDLDEADRLHREGLRIAEELGLWLEAAERLSGLGNIAMLRRQYDRAREFHEQGLRLAVEQANKPGEIHARIGLGLVARRAGELDVAEAELRKVLAWHRQVDFEVGSALILAELGFVAEQRCDTRLAFALHRDGLAAARSNDDPRAVALALEGLAGAYALAGDHRQAALLLGAATDARESTGAPLPDAEADDVKRISARARTGLGADRYDEAFAHGRCLGINGVATEHGYTTD